MNSSDESKNADTSNTQGPESTGKVLPFRRPATVQPTLQRRPGATHQLKNKNAKTKKPEGSDVKTNLARWLYIGLLIVGIALALRNCGKL